MKKNFYITTPIYYASGSPHIGHAYTTIIADVINRYKKLLGYETCFFTGMDEHGQKIAEKAKSLNLTEQELVDKVCLEFKDLWNILDIKYDLFARTTSENHVNTVKKIFSNYYNKNLIYLDNWNGYYCSGCEENKTEKEIVIKDNIKYCSIGHKVELKSEESYFYKIKQNKDWLLDLYKKENFIIPEFRKKELINNFVDNDLIDLSVTRISTTWGIQINENKNHYIYVWLDALFSYLTNLNYLNSNEKLFNKFWGKDTQIVQLMSKEITRFHCVYWPIFLKDLNLRLPDTILSHGWIVTKEGKMSKSLGNVIDPKELINKYGSDILRYFLVKEINLFSDGIFNEELLVEVFNSDLANNIGNLCSRTIGMLSKYFDSTVLEYKNINQQINDNYLKLLNNLKHSVIENIEKFNISELIKEVINLINYCNKLIEETKPWELFKNNDLNLLSMIMYILFHTNYIVSNLLEPVLTKGSNKLKEQLNIKEIKFSIDNINNLKLFKNHKVNNSIIVYSRIINK